MSDNRNSRAAFWILLLIHCGAVIPLFALSVVFVSRFGPLFERLNQTGELPALTSLVILASEWWYWLLPSGMILDAAVLYVLSHLPGSRRWCFLAAWFGLVLAAIFALLILAMIGLVLPVQKMSLSV